MANAIEVRFAVGGVAEVDRAFRSVEQAAVRLERTSARSYESDVKAAQRASRDKEREQARADRDRERAASAHERAQIKLTEQSVAAVAKAAADKLKIEERWARESLKYAHSASLARQRIIDNELAYELRAREKHARMLGSAAGSGLSRSAGMMAHGATSAAGLALSLGGGLSIQDILQQRKALERQASLFSNQTSTDAGGRVPTSQIMAQAKAIALANNQSATDVVGGMNAFFAKTGDVKGSTANARLFAQLATATGSDITQIGSVAGALKVQNPNLDDKAMRAMLLNVVGQTRTGAVDMPDLVKHIPVITSTSALYGGDQADNQRKLIGLSQVAMRTAGSPAEAATSVARLGTDIANHADKIKSKTGFDVKDKNGQLKDASEIIAHLMQASGGDVGKLKHDFGIGDRSMKLFTAEEQTFRGAGGGKAGADAVRKDIQHFENGGYTEESLKSDLSNSLNTTGAKFEQVVERIKDSVEQKMVPYLERFADKFPEIEPKIEQVVDALGRAAEFLTEHPFEAIFALIAANVAADVAKAAIGDAIKKSIFGGGGAPVPVPGGGGGGPGGPGGGGGMLTGIAATGGWLAAFYSGEHLLEAGSDAYDMHKNGRNTAATAHAYLDKWQSGNAGWIGGAKWNPLVQGANIITGLMSDAGEVKAGEKYDGQDLDAVSARSEAASHKMFGTGTGTKHKDDDDAVNYDKDGKLRDDHGREIVNVLKDIAASVKNGPTAPNRNVSQSDPARGGTK